jgi:hypothetical protein
MKMPRGQAVAYAALPSLERLEKNFNFWWNSGKLGSFTDLIQKGIAQYRVPVPDFGLLIRRQQFYSQNWNTSQPEVLVQYHRNVWAVTGD